MFVVIIDVNDNPPHFDQDTYDVTIMGSAPNGSDVLRVNATDADSSHNGHVRYSIEDPASIFAVDEHTGQIRTNGALGGASEEYLLTVTATDEGDPPLASAATVRITVAREQEKKAAIEFEKVCWQGCFDNLNRAFSSDIACSLIRQYLLVLKSCKSWRETR